MVEVKGQSQSFPRNVKNHEKIVKDHNFLKNIDFCHFRHLCAAITLLPVVDRIAQHKSWNNFKKLRAGVTFLKKSLFDTPNL